MKKQFGGTFGGINLNTIRKFYLNSIVYVTLESSSTAHHF